MLLIWGKKDKGNKKEKGIPLKQNMKEEKRKNVLVVIKIGEVEKKKKKGVENDVKALPPRNHSSSPVVSLVLEY